MPYANPDYRKAYYEKNKEKVKAQSKAYYEKNKEKARAWEKTYYEKNKEKVKAQRKAYFEKNKEKVKAQRKAYYEKNKEKIKAQSKAYKEKNKGRFTNWVRARNLKSRYGISLHEYNLMLTEQKGKCACCGIHQNELPYKLYVDHDHDTGLIRGLLCSNCNTSIGKLGDNIEGLMKALNYLEKHELTKERKTNEHVVQVKPKPNVQVKVQRGHLQSQVPA
tara:strand:- start:288 stop:947 length:660 start_codon:yes stop_codon:yes gene_type:complete